PRNHLPLRHMRTFPHLEIQQRPLRLALDHIFKIRPHHPRRIKRPHDRPTLHLHRLHHLRPKKNRPQPHRHRPNDHHGHHHWQPSPPRTHHNPLSTARHENFPSPLA